MYKRQSFYRIGVEPQLYVLHGDPGDTFGSLFPFDYWGA